MGLLSSFKKEVLDDVFGIESPREAISQFVFGGLPVPETIAPTIEKKLGTSWESGGEWFGPSPKAPTVTRGISITPPSKPANSWAWTQNYLASQRAVAEQAKIQSEKEAEAMAKQAQGAQSVRNGTILPGIVPAIILLYLVWTK